MSGDDTPFLLELLRSAGPLVAAAVALYIAFRSERRLRRERPELRLIYEHDNSDDFQAGVGPGPSHWVRLRVANKWGKRTAEDVEVLLVDVRPRGDRASLNGFGLRWSNAFVAGSPTTRQTIPPGVAPHVDLLSMARPDHGGWSDDPPIVDGETVATLVLEIEPTPTDNRRFLPAGRHTLFVALTAKDTDAAYYAVNVEYDGVWWSADDARDHMKVSVDEAQYFGLEPETAWRRDLAWWDRIGMRFEALRWLNPFNWQGMRAVRRARRLYPGRAVQIDATGRITPIEDVLPSRTGGGAPP